MKELRKAEKTQFQDTIWNYYEKHGRKMPWRGEEDPYKVLVSEIMLQQTQVARVTLKYAEFLKKFPTLGSLAKASLSDVLKVWQGLGYNRRARFLHEFAKEVVKNHKGKVPSDYEILLTLPGIGKGTAGSLSAFAFNLPVAFIETNIRRVYIHHFFKDKESVADAEILPIVEATVDEVNPQEWYYALMDYGVHLKGKVKNPNQRSKHYAKQSKFEGSNREVRGGIIKELTVVGGQSLVTLRKKLKFDAKRFDTALKGLIKEGFVIQKGTSITLV